MAQLEWDVTTEREYETGVDHGVLFKKDLETGKYGSGVVWNGLTAVTESPSGAEPTPIYADNIKYLNLMSAEEFGATIEAFTYPDEFEECDGTKEVAPGVTIGQQPRVPFGFSYRTLIGDADNPNKGYKIHLVYGMLASASEKSRATVNDSPEAATFSWETSTTPEAAGAGNRPTSHLVVTSITSDPTDLAAFEATLYGSATEEPELPSPAEVIALFGTP